MSHSSEVARSEDETIEVTYTRDDGVTYYRIGKKIGVSWRGKQFGEERMYLCHHCRLSSCSHTRRIKRYREENP